MNHIETKLPKKVFTFCKRGANIVGERALKEAFPDKYGDLECDKYELIVPVGNWKYIASLIPGGASTNIFGGFDFKTKDVDGNDVELSIWMDEAINYLSRLTGDERCVFCPISGVIYHSFIKETEKQGEDGE